MKVWQVALDRSKEALLEPTGYHTVISESEDSSRRARDLTKVKQKKAWDTAKSPAKSIFFTMLMLWMSGSSINIFSIMMVGMALWTPLRSMLTFTSAFAPFASEKESLLAPMLLYLALNSVILLAGLYKFSVLGLIPTNAEDWINLAAQAQSAEQAAGVLV